MYGIRHVPTLSSGLTISVDSGRYYSFPSFDMYEEDQQDEQKENQPKSP